MVSCCYVKIYIHVLGFVSKVLVLYKLFFFYLCGLWSLSYFVCRFDWWILKSYVCGMVSQNRWKVTDPLKAVHLLNNPSLKAIPNLAQFFDERLIRKIVHVFQCLSKSCYFSCSISLLGNRAFWSGL